MTQDLKNLKEIKQYFLDNRGLLQTELQKLTTEVKEAGQDIHTYIRNNVENFAEKYPNSAKFFAATAIYVGGEALIKKSQDLGIFVYPMISDGKDNDYLSTLVVAFLITTGMLAYTDAPAGTALLLGPVLAIQNNNLSEFGDKIQELLKDILPAASLMALSQFFKSEDKIEKVTLNAVKEWAEQNGNSDIAFECKQLLDGKSNDKDTSKSKINAFIESNGGLKKAVQTELAKQSFVKDLLKSGIDGALVISAVRAVLSSSNPLLTAGILVAEKAFINHASQDKTFAQRMASAYENLPSTDDMRNMLARAQELVASVKERVVSTATSAFTATPVQKNNTAEKTM